MWRTGASTPTGRTVTTTTYAIHCSESVMMMGFMGAKIGNVSGGAPWSLEAGLKEFPLEVAA